MNQDLHAASYHRCANTLSDPRGAPPLLRFGTNRRKNRPTERRSENVRTSTANNTRPPRPAKKGEK